VVLAVPDGAVADAAASVAPDDHAVVAHLAGSLGLEVLGDHPRRAALHPLVSLPDAETGAARLASGVAFAVAGDPLVQKVVGDLNGRALHVGDEDRGVYHAAAAVASNHLVALLGQVERLANGIGIPVDAYLDLVRASVDNVAALGPAAALTGPVARGDWATVARHLRSLPAEERRTYLSLATEAARLAGRDLPADLLDPPARSDDEAGGGAATS